MKVLVKKLHTDSVIPSFGSEYAAGADLYAYLDGTDRVAIPPHATLKIGTGVAKALLFFLESYRDSNHQMQRSGGPLLTSDLTEVTPYIMPKA